MKTLLIALSWIAGTLVELFVIFNVGEDASVLEETDEWFRLVMTGALPRVAPPRAFTPDELQNVQTPFLLIIGSRDNLTGNPDAVRALAEHVPDIAIHVLDSGHLIGMEKADEVNALMEAFFTGKE